MLTVAETEFFSRLVSDYWNESDREAFAATWHAIRTPATWYQFQVDCEKYAGRAPGWASVAACE